jgi:hypothetical protein
VKLVGTLEKDEVIRFTLAGDPLNELADAMGNVIEGTVLNIDLLASNAVGINPGTSSGTLSFSSYPNPFFGTTTFAYNLPVAGEVTLELRDMLGSLIKTMVVKEMQTSGDHRLAYNFQELPAGVYMVTLKLTSGDQPMMRTIKIVRNH